MSMNYSKSILQKEIKKHEKNKYFCREISAAYKKTLVQRIDYNNRDFVIRPLLDLDTYNQWLTGIKIIPVIRGKDPPHFEVLVSGEKTKVTSDGNNSLRLPITDHKGVEIRTLCPKEDYYLVYAEFSILTKAPDTSVSDGIVGRTYDYVKSLLPSFF